jgi:queuosine precursor transporter
MNNNLGGKNSNLFLYMCVAFIGCLLLSNLITGKLVQIFGMVFTAGLIIFPITYILGDIFTEVYGFNCSRRVIWIGFVCNFFAVLIYLGTLSLPYPEFWNEQNAYVAVLGTSTRIFIASLVAYLFGNFLNAITLSKIKVAMNGKKLWYRTILSSLVGHAFDTVIFITTAFWGVYDTSVIWQMILFEYVWKCGYEILLTPVTCYVIKLVKKTENIDVYDIGEKYNPFRGTAN